MKELKYFSNSDNSIRSLQLDIMCAKTELEKKIEEGKSEDLSSIVQIFVDDSAGKYAMKEFTVSIGVMTEEEYEARQFVEEDGEICAFDTLLEDVNEELEVYLKEYELNEEGFSIIVQWYEGSIVLMMHPQS